MRFLSPRSLLPDNIRTLLFWASPIQGIKNLIVLEAVMLSQSSIKNNAGVLVRFAAFLYDALLIIGLWFLVGAIFVAVNAGESVSANNPFLSIVLFLVTFWFNCHFWRRGGQTLGMRAWRLRLINQHDTGLSLQQCLLRFIVAMCSILTCGLGYFWSYVDKDKLTWQDRLSNTRVIREPKKIK